jgi:hypothetical protein
MLVVLSCMATEELTFHGQVSHSPSFCLLLTSVSAAFPDSSGPITFLSVRNAHCRWRCATCARTSCRRLESKRILSPRQVCECLCWREAGRGCEPGNPPLTEHVMCKCIPFRLVVLSTLQVAKAFCRSMKRTSNSADWKCTRLVAWAECRCD